MKIFSFVKNVACSLLLSASLLCLLSCGRGKDSTAIAPNGWDDDTEANSVLNVALPGGKTLEMIKVKRGSFQIVAPFAVQKTFESRDCLVCAARKRHYKRRFGWGNTKSRRNSGGQS